MTEERFYQLLAEATMIQPEKDLICKTPQTFAVINDFSDLNTPNLGKTYEDVRNGFFYSREWIAKGESDDNISWAYPLVCIEFFNLKPSVQNNYAVYSFTLRALDKERDFCSDDKCSRRNQHQIESDTTKIVFNVISYLSTVQKAVVNDTPENYYSKYYLEWLRTQPEQTIKITVPKVILFVNDEWYGVRSDTTIDKVYGTDIRVSVRLDFCPDKDFNYNKLDPKNVVPCCG